MHKHAARDSHAFIACGGMLFVRFVWILTHVVDDTLPFRRLHEPPTAELRATFHALAHASPLEVRLQAGDILYLSSTRASHGHDLLE